MATLEDRELALIGKVELRIALADSDLKLEAILKTFLAPLLLKLASEHVNVRNKVIKVCQHINTRILSPTIKIPVASLLSQFKEHSDTPLIRHFDLIYIQQGIDRLSKSERVELLPSIFHGLAADAARSLTHGAILLNLVFRLLPQLSLPPRGTKEDDDFRERLGFRENPTDSKFLATWLGKAILLNLVGNRPAAHATSIPFVNSCPGLSSGEYEVLTMGKKETWDSSKSVGINLSDTKITIAKFLASGAFTDEERFLPAIFASAEPDSRISSIGDDILKRTTTNISLEDPILLNELFRLYCGSEDTTDQKAPLPVNNSLKIRILGYLSKSNNAIKFSDNIVFIVENSLALGQANDGLAQFSGHGLKKSKLHSAIFSFMNWIARMGAPKDLELISPKLVYSLRDYIENQGWPQPKESLAHDPTELSLRGYAYECIGLLAKSSPKKLFWDPNIDMLRFLFHSLSLDGSGDNIPVSVEEALGSILNSFSDPMDTETLDALRNFFLENMKLQVGQSSLIHTNSKILRSPRFVTLRFSNRCLAYSDVVARWINLMALGSGPGERSEVIEEGKKGLDPYWYKMLHSSVTPSAQARENPSLVFFPDFVQLIEYFFSTSSPDEMDVDDPSTMENFPSKMITAYAPAVSYCRLALVAQAFSIAKSNPEIDANWEKQMESDITSNETSRQKIRSFLETLSRTEKGQFALSLYFKSCFDGMIWNNGEGLERCGEYFVEFFGVAPDSLAYNLSSGVIKIMESVNSNKIASRSIAAHALGLLASHESCSLETLHTIIGTLTKRVNSWKDAVGTEANRVHGSILSLAYLISRLSHRGRLRFIEEENINAFLSLVLEILESSKDNLLLEAALLSIDQFSIFSLDLPSRIKPPHSARLLLGRIVKMAKSGDEKATLALGHISMEFSEIEKDTDSIFTQILENLFALHEVRQPEFQFAVGEALSCVAIGWESKSLIVALDTGCAPPTTPIRSDTLSTTMDKILDDCKSTKPTMRKACSIWLLCLIQFCGHFPETVSRLRRCQTAFKNFLSDRDDLVQETASRGLTLLYEKGDKDLKDNLIHDLVFSFTGTNANLAGNVDNETQLFEPGALPTGDGSVSTYKDIMSLATEVGDPSLVYRFMSLATNNAIWSSRAAFGRFGLSNILSDSSIDGYLAKNPKLYPKLFRYRFDPNTNVQRSMNDIWMALVKDTGATVDKHFDYIMEDILKSVLGKEWRVRQASCAAIADLIQGRIIDKYEKYLSQIWTLAFKVLDDIKESVRTAAMNLCRVLTGTLIRNLESGHSHTTDAMLKNVMPFLMSPAGVEASAQEVQMFALDTVLKISKKAGAALRPFIPSLVERLIGLLSTLEPQAVNYLHLNASKYNLTEEKIDAARLVNVQSSPIMDAIEKCLDQLDEPTMKTLAPNLENAIKQAVGMPSKAGCSRVLVSLSTRHNNLFRPYADTFLQVLQRAVMDRNETVASAYASSAGYVARLASDEQILNLLSFSKKLYFDSEDRFAALSTEFLPFVFVVKHDNVEHAKELFEKTWNENVGGSRAIVLYLKEIIALAVEHMNSPRWGVKHTSALAIADIVSSSASELDIKNAQSLWEPLQQAIAGKTWDGKEEVLAAFAKFANTAYVNKNPQITQEMKKFMLREARRNNPLYQQHALRSVALFSESPNAPELSSEVFELVAPIIQPKGEEEDEMDVDSKKEGESTKTVAQAILVNALLALFSSINPELLDGQALEVRLTKVAELVQQVRPNATTSVQSVIFEGIKKMFDRMSKHRANNNKLKFERDEKSLIQFFQIIEPLDDGAEALRQKRCNAAEAIAQFSRSGNSLRLIQQAVREALSREKAISVQSGLERILEISSAAQSLSKS
ncbi:MAG: proteasome component M29 [Trizodia sp. TS-e1964]|nr:MAG: proteasome component M29 [Trizodia sp. TS-e1964]